MAIRQITHSGTRDVILTLLVAIIVISIMTIVRPSKPTVKKIDINTRSVIASDECAKQGYEKARLLKGGGIVCTHPNSNMMYIPKGERAP